MAKFGLPKGSGKRLKVREKSGNLKSILSGNPVEELCVVSAVYYSLVGFFTTVCVDSAVYYSLVGYLPRYV